MPTLPPRSRPATSLARATIAVVAAAIFAAPAGTAGDAWGGFSGPDCGILDLVGTASMSTPTIAPEATVFGAALHIWAPIGEHDYYGRHPVPNGAAFMPIESNEPVALSVSSTSFLADRLMGRLFPPVSDSTMTPISIEPEVAAWLTLDAGGLFEPGLFEPRIAPGPSRLDALETTLDLLAMAAMSVLDRPATIRAALGRQASASAAARSRLRLSAVPREPALPLGWDWRAAEPIATPLARDERGLLIPLVIEPGPFPPHAATRVGSAGAAAGKSIFAAAAVSRTMLERAGAYRWSSSVARRSDVFERIMQWLAIGFAAIVLLVPALCACASRRIARSATPSAAVDRAPGGFLDSLSTGLARAPSF